MSSERQRAFLDRSRVGHLVAADAGGQPHLIPVCHAVEGATLYITVDENPKRQGRPLKRLRNILENPQAAFIVDRWDEDWRRLGWVMLRGRAEILADGAEHDHAQALLTTRYPQYRSMSLALLPVIALRISPASDSGKLSDE